MKSPLISYQIVGVPQPPHRLLLMVNELYIGDRSDVKMQLRLPNVGEAKLLHYREAVETSVRARGKKQPNRRNQQRLGYLLSWHRCERIHDRFDDKEVEVEAISDGDMPPPLPVTACTSWSGDEREFFHRVRVSFSLLLSFAGKTKERNQARPLPFFFFFSRGNRPGQQRRREAGNPASRSSVKVSKIPERAARYAIQANNLSCSLCSFSPPLFCRRNSLAKEKG